jgi:hypothetical protein
MALTLRRSDLERSPAMAHLDDGKPVGRIYSFMRPRTPWFWWITEYVEPRSGLRTSGMTETLDAAKGIPGQLRQMASVGDENRIRLGLRMVPGQTAL